MAKKIKKYKVGMDSETYAISLVESPAIEEEMIALEKQEPIKIQLANEEKHMVYSAVLIPDKPIYRRNADGDEYYLEFSKESIEKMSQEFLKEYRQSEITVDHNDIAPEVTVVESWLKSDLYKDKSVALGLNDSLPIGTWFAGMKVNNVEIWERIKKGELKGFSVESMVSLEDFSKVENNNDNYNDMNEEMLFSKIKKLIADFFKKEDVDTEASETSKITPTEEEIKMEETAPTVEEKPTETPVEEPKVEEPTPTPTVEEKAPEEPKNAPEEKDNHLEELINNLKEEIEALKGVNKDLTSKVKSLEKEPSAKPVNTNSKASKGDTYAQWRETMRGLIG